MSNLRELLIENPVIAALRKEEDLPGILKSNAQIIFVLCGNILTIAQVCQKLKEAGKIVFIHMDLMEGLRGDAAALAFIKEHADPVGIISTKTNIIKYGKNHGLKTILRIFMIDSLSLRTGIKNINETNPDAVEVMPGIAPKIIQAISDKTHAPIIAGGLIETKKDVMEALSAGAVAASTTAKELWEM